MTRARERRNSNQIFDFIGLNKIGSGNILNVWSALIVKPFAGTQVASQSRSANKIRKGRARFQLCKDLASGTFTKITDCSLFCLTA